MKKLKACVIRTKNKQFLFLFDDSGKVIAGFKTALPNTKPFDELIKSSQEVYKSLSSDKALKAEALSGGMQRFLKHLVIKYKVLEGSDTAESKKVTQLVEQKSQPEASISQNEQIKKFEERRKKSSGLGGKVIQMNAGAIKKSKKEVPVRFVDNTFASLGVLQRIQTGTGG